MKKVLVGVSSGMDDLWPVIHALNLARRVKTRLFVLFVVRSPEACAVGELSPGGEPSTRTRLEGLISEGRSWGIPIDYYIANGSYKEELIRLIQGKGIALVVLGIPPGDQKGCPEDIRDILDEIKLRTSCDIEIVYPKKPVKEE